LCSLRGLVLKLIRTYPVDLLAERSCKNVSALLKII